MINKLIASQFKKPSGILGIFTSNLMVKSNSVNYDILLNKLNPEPQDKILEIGFGPGIGINKIAEKCTSCIVHGVDFSRLMYNRASKFNRLPIG